MNTQMYIHPLTESHLNVVSETLGYTVVGPIGKGLACGDTGKKVPSNDAFIYIDLYNGVGTGAMTEWLDIVQIVVDRFRLSRK